MKNMLFLILMISCYSVLAEETVGEYAGSISYPVEGNWYNPDESGTGYIVHIQKGYVFGMYFGYDEVGKQRWMTFQGQLQKSEQDDVEWELTSTLTSLQNGNAFNEHYQA